MDDVAELVRPRRVMLADLGGVEPVSGRWLKIAEKTLRERLADPLGALAAFVVDKSEPPADMAARVRGRRHRVPAWRSGQPKR